MKELVEFLCGELVEDPDAVQVTESFDERGPTYHVTVGPGELGKVIGRGGRTAKAIRTVVRAAASRSASPRSADDPSWSISTTTRPSARRSARKRASCWKPRRRMMSSSGSSRIGRLTSPARAARSSWVRCSQAR